MKLHNMSSVFYMPIYLHSCLLLRLLAGDFFFHPLLPPNHEVVINAVKDGDSGVGMFG